QKSRRRPSASETPPLRPSSTQHLPRKRAPISRARPRPPTDRPCLARSASRTRSRAACCGRSPWRLSRFQKRRHRLRLRAVDSVVATLDAALAKKGQTLEALERWKAEMPTEAEMLPRDKYTMFDRKAKKYRKGIHKLPKWTRVSQRVNPPGY
ncbi:hypothetical protein ACCO45_011539, partial [Purpureocillium lilacinum]